MMTTTHVLTVFCAAVLSAAVARADILLLHSRIATEPAVQAFSRSRNPHDKMSAAPPGSHALSRRGTQAYIVQLTGEMQPAWQRLLRDLHVTVHDFVPRNAVIIECAPAQLEQLAALECVQWIGAYRPEYKTGRVVFDTGRVAELSIQTFTEADTTDGRRRRGRARCHG